MPAHMTGKPQAMHHPRYPTYAGRPSGQSWLSEFSKKRRCPELCACAQRLLRCGLPPCPEAGRRPGVQPWRRPIGGATQAGCRWVCHLSSVQSRALARQGVGAQSRALSGQGVGALTVAHDEGHALLGQGVGALAVVHDEAHAARLQQHVEQRRVLVPAQLQRLQILSHQTCMLRSTLSICWRLIVKMDGLCSAATHRAAPSFCCLLGLPIVISCTDLEPAFNLCNPWCKDVPVCNTAWSLL